MKHIVKHYAKLVPVSLAAIAAWISVISDGQISMDSETVWAGILTVASAVTWRVPQQKLPNQIAEVNS